MPLDAAVEGFMDDFRAGKIFTGQSFPEAFADYLNENYEEQISVENLESIELPEYLQMKLVILDSRGKVVKVHRGMPEGFVKDSTTGRERRQCLSQSGFRRRPEFPPVRRWSMKGKRWGALCS